MILYFKANNCWNSETCQNVSYYIQRNWRFPGKSFDQSLNILLMWNQGWGGQACYFGNLNFEILVEGVGQDTSQPFEGSFGSMRAMLPVWGLAAKIKSKTKDVTLWFCHHSIRLEKTSIFKKRESNRTKNGRIMSIRRSCAKVAVGLFLNKLWPLL